MTEDHHLDVFDEPPLKGKAANIEAWRGYTCAFPRYVIYPHQVVERDSDVAVLGHTTGSHLGLSDAEESKVLMIWQARVTKGKLACWQLVEDTRRNRERAGLPHLPELHCPITADPCTSFCASNRPCVDAPDRAICALRSAVVCGQSQSSKVTLQTHRLADFRLDADPF